MRKIDASIRLLVACVFFLSSYSKGVDPVGAGFIFDKYLISLNMLSVVKYMPTFVFLMIVLEFMVGVFILIPQYAKTTLWVSSGVLIFFTFLISASMVFSLSDDCGCFGTLIKFSNTTSIIKNIVLLGLILLDTLYVRRKIEVYGYEPIGVS